MKRGWAVLVSWPGLPTPIHIRYTWTRRGGWSAARHWGASLTSDPLARRIFRDAGIDEITVAVVRRG